MQRSTLFCGMVVALLAGSVAQADEAPPADAVQPAAPTPERPPERPVQEQQTKIEPVAPPPPRAIQSVAPETAEAVLGQRVVDPTGKDIGRLVDVLVGANGQPQAGIIDFGGFMGVGNRKVAVHWNALRFIPGDAKRKITLDMTPDQIQDAPEFRNPNKAASVVTPAEPAPLSP
jgi:hypothetical protein